MKMLLASEKLLIIIKTSVSTFVWNPHQHHHKRSRVTYRWEGIASVRYEHACLSHSSVTDRHTLDESCSTHPLYSLPTTAPLDQKAPQFRKAKIPVSFIQFQYPSCFRLYMAYKKGGEERKRECFGKWGVWILKRNGGKNLDFNGVDLPPFLTHFGCI